MPQSKYETPSRDVQAVLNKPPSSLMLWGNAIVILVIGGGIWMLSLFQFPVKVIVPFQVIAAKEMMLFPLGPLPPKVIPANKVTLQFESYPVEQYGVVLSRINNVSYHQGGPTLQIEGLRQSVTTNTHKVIPLETGMKGKAEITVGHKGLWDMLVESYAARFQKKSDD